MQPPTSRRPTRRSGGCGHAARGERRVDGREIGRGHRVPSDRDVGPGLPRARLARQVDQRRPAALRRRYAKGDRDIADPGRPDPLGQRVERCAQRLDHRLFEGAVRALHAVAVEQRRAVAVREEPRRRAVPLGGEADALAQRGGEHDRRERRGGRPPRRGVVEVALAAVAAVVGAHGTGGRVDRDERGAQPVRLGARSVAATESTAAAWTCRSSVVITDSPRVRSSCGGNAVRGDLLLHLVDDEAVGSAHARPGRHRRVLRRLIGPAGAAHRVDDPGPAIARRGRVDRRVEVPRVLDDGRQHRTLGEAQLRRRYPEIGVRGGGDAVRAASEVDGVQVPLEDFVLAVPAFQLDRERELLRLAGERAFLAEVRVAGVLLGDGRRALPVAGGVRPDRAGHAARRDGAVLVEVAVLGGQHGPADRQRNLGQRHVIVVGDADAGQHRVPVAVVQHGCLRLQRIVGQAHRLDVRLHRRGPQQATAATTQDTSRAPRSAALSTVSVPWPLPPMISHAEGTRAGHRSVQPAEQLLCVHVSLRSIYGQ